MSWLRPLQHNYRKPTRAIRRTDGALMPESRPRAVVVNGTHYESMIDACRALGWSYSKVYRSIGEAWRYEK
jgi:hypothetical protein